MLHRTSRIAIAIATGAVIANTPVDAATRCVTKMANGTGPTADVAKFEVYEGLLRTVDGGLWATWIATGATPGYRTGQPSYACRTGMGLGVSCRGRMTFCKRPD